MTNRREFLQTTAAITGSFILPTSLFATPSSNFHFIHAASCKHWPVADPVQWSLQNAYEPILEHAADGLGKLTLSDGERIIRLVVRRCSLNLLEVHPGRVVVDHWGQNRADLKPFFKDHGLARPEVEVVLKDRKKETVTTLTGDSFLYGVLIASDFDLERFQQKWASRFVNESDDWQAAPGTSSGFAWDGLPDGSIPWAAMKSAWRLSQPTSCLNCDKPTILVNFGYRQVGLFNRSPNFVSICPQCQRSFVDESITDVVGWMAGNLKTEFCPVGEVVWGKRVELVTI